LAKRRRSENPLPGATGAKASARFGESVLILSDRSRLDLLAQRRTSLNGRFIADRMRNAALCQKSHFPPLAYRMAALAELHWLQRQWHPPFDFSET